MEETQTTGNDAPAQIADTADPQTSAADLQVTNDAPEAAPVEEPTVKATDTVEEKLYAGKYKSVEEMEKAYTELQSKYTNTSQEKAEMSRLLTEAFSTPEPTVQNPDAPFEEPDPVQSEIESVKRSQAVMMFVMNHQDADAGAMKEVLASDPLVKQIQGHEAKLEYAYMKSQSMRQPKAIEEAQKAGAQQAQVKIAEKQTAQVESAQKAEEIQESLMEKATGNYSGAEREAARKELIRKHLVNL